MIRAFVSGAADLAAISLFVGTVLLFAAVFGG